MRWAQDRLGPKRAATSYAWLAFLNKGVTLAFGTDYPVEPVTPFRGLYAAVTRKSENGKQEYFPAQRLTMDQAIAAYTTGSAFAEFEEKEKGKLAPGMLADFVVLDRDLTASSPEKLLATKVLRTVVGGKDCVTRQNRGSPSAIAPWTHIFPSKGKSGNSLGKSHWLQTICALYASNGYASNDKALDRMRALGSNACSPRSGLTSGKWVY